MIAQLLRARRALLTAGVLGLSVLSIPLTAHPAAAGLITCATDPTVYLSNGDVLTLSAHIETDISSVSQVDYTLFVPNNVSVTQVAYDDYGSIEKLTVASSGPNSGSDDREHGRGRDHHGYRYRARTTVLTTTDSSVPVTVRITVSGGASSTSTGMSGQPIDVSL